MSISVQNYKSKMNISSFYKESDKFLEDSYNSILIVYFNNKVHNVIISSDIIWFSRSCSEFLRKMISKELKIEMSSIALSASHTHGSPNPDKNIINPSPSPKFNSYLKNEIVKLFKKAIKGKLIKVKLTHKSFENKDFSISRRRKALKLKPSFSYEMQSLPNKRNLIDTNIDVVEFKNEYKIICIIIRLTCHPVAAPKNVYGSDYIGYLRKFFRSKNIDIFFMQGFSGDIRPKLIYKEKTLKDILIRAIIGIRFRKSEINDAKNIGKIIYNTIIKNKLTSKSNIEKLLNSYQLFLKIPLQDNTSLKQALEICVWNWDKIVFIFMNAEVLNQYNISIFDDKKILCVGYTNGMVGYLPTKEEVAEGGYEIDKSRKHFQWSARIDKNFSQKVKIKVRQVLNSLINLNI